MDNIKLRKVSEIDNWGAKPFIEEKISIILWEYHIFSQDDVLFYFYEFYQGHLRHLSPNWHCSQLALPPTGTSLDWHFPQLALTPTGTFCDFLCYWEFESFKCRYTDLGQECIFCLNS